MTPIFLGLIVLIFLNVTRVLIHHARYERMRKEFNCPPLRKYPGWDMLYGLDFVYANLRALKSHRFLEFQKQAYSTKVWTANFLGNRMIYSSKAENIKAISTAQRECFAIEPIRVANGALAPFTGRGVSSSDGQKWHESRILVKPYFERAVFTNIDRLCTHTDRLIAKIPTDGSTIDMQPLCQRWFLDTSTEFLFGESVNSLENCEKDWPHRDMVKIMEGLRLRLQLSSFLFLHRDQDWLAACSRIHKFLDGHINKAYQQLHESKLGKAACYADGRPRNDFLWTIVGQISDPLELRTQLTGVWIPSNETTSIFVSNTLFALARNPIVVEKLRQEILNYGDQQLTFAGLRSLTYLRWILNESHRLYPVSLQTVRACVKDTTLPSGGGSNGNAPIFCAKGDIVHCNRYLMHRDPDIWGDDAEDFQPERWETARPKWNFVPFGGGPRICPAQVMVDTECSYVIFRLFKKFKRIETRDNEPWTAVMRVGPSNKHGCKVAFSV